MRIPENLRRHEIRSPVLQMLFRREVTWLFVL